MKNLRLFSSLFLALVLSAAGFAAADDKGPGTYFVPTTGTANVVDAQSNRVGCVRRTVAFLGGSITEMHGFRPRVMTALRARYPEIDFVEIAAGLSSTCSDAGACRLQRDVLAHGVPDLFVVEEAVNDDQDGHFDTTHARRGLEGIVRQVKEANPACAVVVGLLVNRGQYATLLKGETPIQYAAHAEVARHYGAAVADVGSALAASAKAGGFAWEGYRDCHPSPEGCDFAAEVVLKAIETVFDPRKTPVASALPAPLDAASYFGVRELPLAEVSCGGNWQVSCPNWKEIAGSKRGYCTVGEALWTETADAECSFAFTGTMVGALLTAGPDAGDLEVSVDGGAWVRQPLRANYGSLHYPYLHVLAEGLPAGAHRIRLKSVPAVRRDKTGSAVRINRLYGNGR